MNRILAETLAVFNVFIALAIIALGAFLGYRMIPFAGPMVGLALGTLAGVTLAAFVCGTIAYIALIERHLQEIARASAGGRRRDGAAGSAHSERQEPTIF